MSEHLLVEAREHHGAVVQTNVPMDYLRKHQCLCLNCAALHGGKCAAAAKLFAVCTAHDIALLVTRCPDWEEPPK